MKTLEIEVRGTVDARAIDQLRRCAEAGDAVRAALCADGHVGYSQPIGGVVAYRDFISPSGVGYDIGCGNKAVKTDIRCDDIVRGTGERRQAQSGSPADEAHKNEASEHAYSSGSPQGAVARIMDEIVQRISFGMGRNNDEPVDHPVLEHIHDAPFVPQRGLLTLAAAQLGTVGAGNHYVDLFSDEEGWLWVGCHFGSRGFGHKTASGFLALAQGKQFNERGTEGEMDSPPVLFPVDSDLGQSYIEAMTLAGEYAYAGRDVVIDKVLDILGGHPVHEVHNHHNFAWHEQHDGERVWVIRKGCTPAWPGQEGFVGATMGESSVILEGIPSEAGKRLLYSTVHGAGRLMSRTQAAGKVKRRKVWECSERECFYQTLDGSQHCPDHGASRMMARGWRTEQIRPGVIDWGAARADLVVKHIELRGGAADEAPGAYKRLHEVLAAHSDTVFIKHTLRPLGVAMAGPDVYDAFKD